MGRARKSGKRTKSGQLSRAGQPRIKVDRGNIRAERSLIVYRGNGSDAIGRLFEKGFIGKGNDAKAMLDTARAIHRAYWAWYTNGPIRCTLADRNSGAGIDNDSERERRQEDWLVSMLKLAGPQGFSRRKYFDELVVDPNFDDGPDWADRLLAGSTRESDHEKLSIAMEVLADCAGVQRYDFRKRA